MARSHATTGAAALTAERLRGLLRARALDGVDLRLAGDLEAPRFFCGEARVAGVDAASLEDEVRRARLRGEERERAGVSVSSAAAAAGVVEAEDFFVLRPLLAWLLEVAWTTLASLSEVSPAASTSSSSLRRRLERELREVDFVLDLDFVLDFVLDLLPVLLFAAFALVLSLVLDLALDVGLFSSC